MQASEIFLSVLTLGEILKGIESLKSRDKFQSKILAKWLVQLSVSFSGRLLPIDLQAAKSWAKMNAKRNYPVIDSLLAATASSQNMILVTRNTKDFKDYDIKTLNPFEFKN